MKNIFLTLLMSFCIASSASAIPYLQLDIADSIYDAGIETIVSTGDAFTLYALVDPFSNKYVANDTYYISAAVLPALTQGQNGSYGSFSFGGTTINVTGSMTFGSPPSASGDLGSHGVFDTYFTEFSFNLGSALKSLEYNAEDSPGGFSLAPNGAKDYLYAVAFAVDVSLLDPTIEIHFDLYNTKTITNKKTGLVSIVLNENAPFSHDAQSGGDDGGGGGGGGTPVPEPSTLILLGAGLAGLAFYRRKKR